MQPNNKFKTVSKNFFFLVSIKKELLYPYCKSTPEMNKDYTKYKAHQLLNDDYFLKSVLHPTAQDHQFWQQLQDENESFR